VRDEGSVVPLAARVGENPCAGAPSLERGEMSDRELQSILDNSTFVIQGKDVDGRCPRLNRVAEDDPRYCRSASSAPTTGKT
jgi:hypothetical protein